MERNCLCPGAVTNAKVIPDNSLVVFRLKWWSNTRRTRRSIKAAQNHYVKNAKRFPKPSRESTWTLHHFNQEWHKNEGADPGTLVLRPAAKPWNSTSPILNHRRQRSVLISAFRRPRGLVHGTKKSAVDQRHVGATEQGPTWSSVAGISEIALD